MPTREPRASRGTRSPFDGARRVAATTTRAVSRHGGGVDARRAAIHRRGRRFSNLVLLFHAWRRRAAANVAGTELVGLAWVKWNRERLETAFGAMHAEVVLARAARVDVADLMNLQKLARIVAAWRGRTADERDAIEPAVQSMARCAAAWRAFGVARVETKVAETRDEEIRAKIRQAAMPARPGRAAVRTKRDAARHSRSARHDGLPRVVRTGCRARRRDARAARRDGARRGDARRA